MLQRRIGLDRKSTRLKNRFEAAYKVAERCGDREGGRRALVSFFEEMRDHLDDQEIQQLLNRLRRLCSITEPSALVGRVGETITAIESMIDKNNRRA